MAKKRGKPDQRSAGAPASMRELACGVKPNAAKGGGAYNPKSMLKLQHLQKLAVWAAGEGSLPSLGAFFGRRLAAVGESLGVPPDPSLFSCQRCETIVQPGYNCTVRIERNRTSKRSRCKKPSTPPQNNVVYTCHFCSHRNLKRGTPKGHLKDVYPPKSKACPKPKPMKLAVQMPSNNSISETQAKSKTEIQAHSISDIQAVNQTSEVGPSVFKGDGGSPVTPVTKLLDSKRRKRNRSAPKKMAEAGSADTKASESATSCKRKRKSWTSLREIAENNEKNISITRLKIPFSGMK